MKTLLTGVVAAALLCLACLAQDATPPSTSTGPQDQQNPAATPSAAPSSMPSSPALRVAPGSVIPVRLTQTIDAKKAKSGDEVQAKVTEDMKNQIGEVLVPKDTKVLGHITEAQARSKEQPQSEVGIAFDHAVVKGKGDVRLPMSIQAIIAPPKNSAANDGTAAPAAPGPTMQQSNSRMPGTPSTGRPATTPSENQTPAPAAGASATADQSAGAGQPITAKTQGIVGISNLKLVTAADSTQASTVSSEKDNVKLQSGTFMLLRVTQ